MAEQDNVALIKKEYEAFSRGDIATVLGNLAKDVEWILEGPSIIRFAGVRRGVAGAASFFATRRSHG